jgi:hypothetical protein
MPFGKPKMKGTGKPASAKQAPPSLKGAIKQAPPSLKGAKKRNVSAMGSKDPIGPQTKREARKSAPKVPMTSAGTAAAKKQKRRATIAKIGGAIAGVGAGVFDYVRGVQKTKGWNKWAYEQQNHGTGKERPSDKELRKLGRGDKKKTK